MNVVLLHIENYPKNPIFKNNDYNTVIYVTNSLPNFIQNIRNIQILIKNYKVYFSGLLFPRNPNLEGVTQTATFALTLLAPLSNELEVFESFQVQLPLETWPGVCFSSWRYCAMSDYPIFIHLGIFVKKKLCYFD